MPPAPEPTPHPDAASTTPSVAARLSRLVLNGVAFELAYVACNAAAQRLQTQRHVATVWDAQWPFVPWMILPYLTSVPLLMLGFAFARDASALRAYSQRLLLATALGCTVFALWPLAFHGARPQPDAPLWAAVYGLLHAVDAPFNQFPSLHVAFMVIVWPTLRAALPPGLPRALLAAWLVLVAASTTFTHQHHLLDVLGGALLGAIARRLVSAQRVQPAVALHYTVAAMLAIVMVLTLQPWWLRLPFAWLALCAAAVARAYARADAQFLHKNAGRFPCWVWLLYGPYLAGYVATWWLVCWHERHHPPLQRVAQRLWVGRRLRSSEAAALLPPDCSVVDLANELAEAPALRRGRYHAVPWLDLQPAPAGASKALMQHIHDELAQGHTVFVHCAMGYRRSRDVARAVLESTHEA